MNVLVFVLLAAAGGPFDRLMHEVAASGRVLEIGFTPSERVAPPRMIAPGAPPLLAFRYYEGLERRRFANDGLMLDDAGH